MIERTSEQTMVWQHMGRLADAGLGTRDGSMDLRDKFALYDTPRAALLTSTPQSNGFIRSSKDDLLVRRPSARLERELSYRLGGVFRRDLQKGLTFSWGKLSPSNINVIFDVILQVAEGSPDPGTTDVPNETEEASKRPLERQGARSVSVSASVRSTESTDRKLGPYTLIDKIGRGAFGVVWLAEKRGAIITTRLALKLPHSEDVNLKAVRDEAAVWVHASGHPNVLPIIEADIYDGQVVIASEYAPDGSLRDWLRRHGGKAPSVEVAVEMTAGILAGLEHLHSRRIIHRDLKPDNILLQGQIPRLADFGIARVLKTTNYTTVSGTPSYMAPEAFDGKHSEQTDLWAVGVILYQLLTGLLPFPQTDITSLIGAIVLRDPEPLPDALPSPLRDVVMRALRKVGRERFISAAEMRQTLNAAGIPNLVPGHKAMAATNLDSGSSLETTLLDVSTEDDSDDAASYEAETVLQSHGAVEFTGDDIAYLEWLDEHPHGFVINTARYRNPRYMVLHRASCGLIKSTEGVAEGGFTTRNYIKICSTDVDALRAWVRRHGRPDGSFSSTCGTCKPLGKGGDTTRPVEVMEPSLLIRINRQYREGMSEQELYEATRGIWKVGERRNEVRLAFAVFRGVVREVYEVEAWHPAGTTSYSTRPVEDVQVPGRWEFTGRRASEDLRERYIGRSVASYLTPGSQNPVTYVNV